MKRLLSNIFVFIALFSFLSAGYLFWERTNPYRLSFASYSTLTQKEVHADLRPVTVRIPSLSIDLPVHTATIEKGKWPASPTGIMHLSSSPIPGEWGNSILYGHNWQNLFGPMKKIQKGDLVEVELSSGETRMFEVVMTDTVTPDQTHILSQSEDARLTLYTCTGFLDRKRFVVTARLM